MFWSVDTCHTEILRLYDVAAEVAHPGESKPYFIVVDRYIDFSNYPLYILSKLFNIN